MAPLGRVVSRDDRRAEPGLDERGEPLDRRAEHDDVVLAERRVVGQEVQDRVAQHLDLPSLAVARVDLHRSVVGTEGEVAGGRCVGAQVVLDPRQ